MLRHLFKFSLLCVVILISAALSQALPPYISYGPVYSTGYAVSYKVRENDTPCYIVARLVKLGDPITVLQEYNYFAFDGMYWPPSETPIQGVDATSVIEQNGEGDYELRLYYATGGGGQPSIVFATIPFEHYSEPGGGIPFTLDALINALANLLQSLLDQILIAINAVITAVGAIVSAIWGAVEFITNWIHEHVCSVLAMLLTLTGFIADYLTNVLSVFLQYNNDMWAWLKNFYIEKWSEFKSWGDMWGNSFITVSNGIRDKIQEGNDWAKNVWWPSFQLWWNAVWAAIQSFLTGLLDQLKTFQTGIWNLFTAFWTPVIEWFKSWCGRIEQGQTDQRTATDGTTQSVRDADNNRHADHEDTKTIWQSILDVLTSIYSNLASWIQAAAASIVSAISAAAGTITSAISSGISSIISAINASPAIINTAIATAGNLVNTTLEAFRNLVETALQNIQTKLNDIYTRFDDLPNMFTVSIKNAANELFEPRPESTSALFETANDFAEWEAFAIVTELKDAFTATGGNAAPYVNSAEIGELNYSMQFGGKSLSFSGNWYVWTKNLLSPVRGLMGLIVYVLFAFGFVYLWFPRNTY